MDQENENERENTENEKESENTENENEVEKNDDALLSNAVSVEEYLIKENVTLLDHEKQMFLDLIHSDGLVVCAKGISYDQVLVNFLKVYADPGNLIFVINASDVEEEYYKSQLDKKHVHDTANTGTERERIYLEGGIHFISTRILVVDMLKNRVPIELITGIIVLRAHTIIESCQEAFLIRLYRQKNQNGFIKALSNSAEAFTMNYNHIGHIMKNLFINELFIWPRFHATIQSSLKPYEPITIEFHVPMTQKQTQIQSHILDIMNYLIKEIKRINRTLDLDEVTVENCITKKFHKILQAQLDCIWHQLSSQTRLIISDLKVLRHIMLSLIYSDAVSSYALIKQYRRIEYAHNNSGWVLLDSAEQLFKISKERVYNDKDEFCPENCPKWKALSEILRVEIPIDARKNHYDPIKVLILCQDTKTCFQLNHYLTQCGEQYLLYMAMKHGIPINKLAKNFQNLKHIPKIESISSSATTSSNISNIKNSKKSLKNKLNKTTSKIFDKEIENQNNDDENLNKEIINDDNDDDVEDFDMLRESYILTTSQVNRSSNVSSFTTVTTSNDIENESEDGTDSSVFEPFPDMENLDITQIVNSINQPLIYIQTFKTSKEGSKSLDNILQNINPQYVIMYHCNVTAIRQLEVYEARQKRINNKRMKVFFLLHAQTVEEQSYLTSLRREKQAFELLINEKSKMALFQHNKLDLASGSAIEDDESILTKEGMLNTRKAGGQTSNITSIKKIIVDMREFRSDLPCILHKRGIEIVPLTISVGDYIITPEICVERKSISDLIGSLNSGRLYNQCLQMQRFYIKPFLLIEFDQNKPFHLQSKYILSSSSTSSNYDILEKLQLLTLYFPKLRLIWSPNPYATAQLFEELKQDKEEPDPIIAASIGNDDDNNGTNSNDFDNFNSNIYDFMIRLPGITSKNIFKIMRNGGNLKELLKKDKEELSKLLDSKENGKLLWDALHETHKPEKPEETITKPQSSKYKKRKGKK